MGERLVKDPQNLGSYLFWVPRADNNVAEMEKITEMGKFTVKSSQGKMLSHTHANLMLHTIDRYINDYNLELNAVITFTAYDLAVNGLGYNYLNLGYDSPKEDDKAQKGINWYIFEKLKEIREISITFYGKFYGETKTSKKAYGVYNTVDMDTATGKIKIQFNEIFTKQLKATKDYVLLDIEEFRSLRPKTAILYQYAVENAQNSPVERNIKELCNDDLHWAAQKPGKLYKDFKESIDEIMVKTDKKVDHEYNEADKKVKFRIMKKIMELNGSMNPEIRDIYEKCPHVIQKHPKCIDMLTDYYNKYNALKKEKEVDHSWGYLVVMANVLYVAEKIDNGKVKKTGAWNYFYSCLENNYGEKFIPVLTEKNERDQKGRKLEILIKEQQQKNREKDEAISRYFQDLYNLLPDEKKKEVDRLAVSYAESNMMFSKDSDLYNVYLNGYCRQNALREMGYQYKKA